MALRAALAQINPTVGDLAGNAALIQTQARSAIAAGANLVVFPEFALTGAPLEGLADRRSFQEAVTSASQTLAQAMHDGGAAVVVFGTLGASKDGRGRGVLTAFDTGGGVPSQAEPGVLEVAGARVGLIPNWSLAERLALSTPSHQAKELDMVAVFAASPFVVGGAARRQQVARRLAERLDAPIAVVNLVGGQDEVVYDGGSFVVERDGSLSAQAERFAATTLMWPGSEARSPDGDDLGDLYCAIVLGIRDYVRKNGFSSAILGLSGGIDSALVAAMACDALGPSSVSAVAMPSVHSSDHAMEDAREAARRMGVGLREESIDALVAGFDQQLGLTGVAAENIQARVRGMVLMGISNTEGQLVLATGNASELATGYTTTYGDAVGGYAPLKDVPKTLVWELARFRNALAPQLDELPPIPDRSITKPPSAELRPGQTDQDTLPDYETLDAILDLHLRRDATREELIAAGFSAAAVETTLGFVDRSEWKRRQYPVGPTVTMASFRRRRPPITSAWSSTAPRSSR
ncbi:MAG: NAD(+) synthase [Micrococcales bacterium]|nr:NAD(+) synthase [Micrococcales bacterium]